MTVDAERDAVLRSLRGALSDGGVLLLDVRESGASRRRAGGVPGTGRLTSGHAASWNSPAPLPRTPAFLTSSSTTLRLPGLPDDHRRFGFVMRPWSESELRERLAAAGFSRIDVGPGVGRATGDRLFVVAWA